MAIRDTASDAIHSSDTPPSTKLIEVVAARKGVAPLDLPERLYDAIDPDALDALLMPSNADGDDSLSVEFTYCGYHVSMDQDGHITLQPIIET